jgi:hypothetical protein
MSNPGLHREESITNNEDAPPKRITYGSGQEAKGSAAFLEYLEQLYQRPLLDLSVTRGPVYHAVGVGPCPYDFPIKAVSRRLRDLVGPRLPGGLNRHWDRSRKAQYDHAYTHRFALMVLAANNRLADLGIPGPW